MHTEPLNPDNLAITVIIPVYNGEAFVARAIQSALDQTCAPAEIVVVDDCSTDSTPEIVCAIATANSRVRLLRNEVNKGPSFGRNHAMGMSNTPLSAFLDADDEWMPNHLAQVQRAFLQFPSASLAFTEIRGREHRTGSGGAGERVEAFEDPLLKLLVANPITQSAAAVRTDHALELGGYGDGARYSEDYALWLRFALAGRQFARVPVVTASQTQHANQVSLKYSAEMYRCAWNYRKQAVAEYSGTVEQASAEIIAALSRAQANDLAAAFNARRRALLEVLIQCTAWIPGPNPLLRDARRRSGWQWPLWRIAAYAYDALPDSLLKLWRNRNGGEPRQPYR